MKMLLSFSGCSSISSSSSPRRYEQRYDYQNHMNEHIILSISQYRPKGGGGSAHCGRITIHRVDIGLRWFVLRFALYMIILEVAFSLTLHGTIFVHLSMSYRLLYSCAFAFLVATLLYIFAPIVEESLILLDQFAGFEYATRRLFRTRSCSRFIATNEIIINEGITMQRVIFYMVAIPRRLQPLVLDDSLNYRNFSQSSHNKGDDDVSLPQHQFNQTVEEDKMKRVNKVMSAIKDNQRSEQMEKLKQEVMDTKVIPLFMHTLPRLDCLKQIYRTIDQFRHGNGGDEVVREEKEKNHEVKEENESPNTLHHRTS